MFFVFLVDQVSKITINTFIPIQNKVNLFADILSITHLANSGSSFQIFRNSNNNLVFIVPVVVVIVFFLHWKHFLQSIAFQRGFAFLMAGSLSNLVDRIRLGYVLDYISVGSAFIFNFADVSIFYGTIIICKNLIHRALHKDKTNASCTM